MKAMKRLAHSALFVACAIRVYRTPNESPWIDNGEDQNTNRPQTSGECAAEACIHSAMLTRQIVDSLKAMWA
jgi:hypothetical protein